jgi:hypothetical protein
VKLLSSYIHVHGAEHDVRFVSTSGVRSHLLSLLLLTASHIVPEACCYSRALGTVCGERVTWLSNVVRGRDGNDGSASLGSSVYSTACWLWRACCVAGSRVNRSGGTCD